MAAQNDYGILANLKVIQIFPFDLVLGSIRFTIIRWFEVYLNLSELSWPFYSAAT